MTLYNISFKEPYLDSIVDFIKSSHQDLSNLKIIVPSSTIRTKLQQIFIKKSKCDAAILPLIIPIGAISSESELVYKVPSDNAEAIGYIEQKLLLIDIINKYQNLNFGLLQASYLSDQLLKLFYEIEGGEINIEALPGIVEIDSALHWMLTAKFLVESYSLWQQEIAKRGKITPIAYQKIILDIEMQNLHKNVIVVGITGGSKSIERFLNFLSPAQNGYVILPPFNTNDFSSKTNPILPYYKISRAIEDHIDEIKLIGNKDSNKETFYNEISHVTAATELEEAMVIARIARYSLSFGWVAIVTNNFDLITLVNIEMQKNGLEINSLLGSALVNSKPAEFLLLLASSMFEGDIVKLAALLKTSYLACDEGYNFEIEYLRKIEVKNPDFSVLIENEWFKNIFLILKPLYLLKDTSQNFSSVLKTHLECAMKLVPRIFDGEDGLAVCEFFKELVDVSCNIGDIKTESYSDFISGLLKGAKYFQKINSNIVALGYRDAALMEFDTFIIADCVEGSFPYHKPPDPWLTNKMRQQINLKTDEEAIGEAHYYFKLLTAKKRVFITSANKNKGRETTVSRFLTLLKNEYEEEGRGNLLEPKFNWFWKDDFLNSIKSDKKKSFLQSRDNGKVDFPEAISATNVELLIRNPYGFYAKKILELLKLDDINKEASLADFGTLMHNIIELYTINYDKNMESKVQLFLDSGKKVLDDFDKHHKMDSWYSKLESVAEDFVIFDELRRKDLKAVYPEVYGELMLDIGNKKIKVTAIADRIEINQLGEVFIIDYKTGAVPTIQNVKNGLSPQLIIEAIIAAEGGFNGISPAEVTKLVYVKIASSKPYFKETVIDISKEELNEHKAALISLLGKYLNDIADFPAMPSQLYEPKYNDYKHLARKL